MSDEEESKQEDTDRFASSPYEIQELLGRGAMGTVYAARHRELDRPVVVKLLHSELAEHEGLLDRMRVEAQTQAKLGGPHILGCSDFGVVDGVPYLVTERLIGQTLLERMRQVPPLSRREVLSIVRQLLLALGVAHRAGVVHRDVKPSNVFLCSDGPIQPFLKLLDFGVVRILEHSELSPNRARTKTGTFMGTPRFASPEQIACKPIDGRSDLYAAGLLAYRLLAGRGPFDEITAQGDVMLAQAFTLPPPPSSFAPWIPAKLEAVILRALEKDPARRFQTAEAFLEALPLPEVDLTEPFPLAPPEPSTERAGGATDDATTTTPFPSTAAEPRGLAALAAVRERARSAADDPTEMGVGLDEQAARERDGAG